MLLCRRRGHQSDVSEPEKKLTISPSSPLPPHPPPQFRADHLSKPGQYASLPEPPFSVPAARAVAEVASGLVLSSGGGNVAVALELVSRAAPRALEDRRVLFKLKRHQVIELLRVAATKPGDLRREREEKKEKEKKQEEEEEEEEEEKGEGAEAEEAPAATTTTSPSSFALPLSPSSFPFLRRLTEFETDDAFAKHIFSLDDEAFERRLAATVRAAKAEALRLLREELAPLALEAEPDAYELFRSTLLLLNEVKEEKGDGDEGGGEGEAEKEGKGGEEEKVGDDDGGGGGDDELARASAGAIAAVASLGESRPPPPPGRPRRSRFEPPPLSQDPSPASATPASPSSPSGLDAAGSHPAAVSGFLRRTLLASLGVRGPPRLEAALRYLSMAAVSAHESRLGATVAFVRKVEEEEAKEEEEERAQRRGGGGENGFDGGDNDGTKSSSFLPSSAFVVSHLGSEAGRDAPPLMPLEEAENAAGSPPPPPSSSSFPRPGSSAHEASVQALREALRLLSREEAARALGAAGGDPQRAVLSELMAWGSDAEARGAIGALAREYAAARGLSVSGGGSSGSDADDHNDDLKKKKKKSSSPSSPPKKSSPSSEAKEAMEQHGEANLTSPPRKARRRRHGSKEEEEDDDDEGGRGSGSGAGDDKASTAATADENFSSIAAGHARVRELLSLALQGRASEVEGAIEAASPGILRLRPAAAFDLRAARLRHLASKGDARAALAEARAALSPLADACPELLLPRLKETMAGLLPGGGGSGGSGGSGNGGSGGGGNGDEALLPPRPPPPPPLDDLRALLLEALGVTEPRLGDLLGELLRVHEAWFAHRCRDALEGAVGLAQLRAPGWDPWASLPLSSSNTAATAVRGAAGNLGGAVSGGRDRGNAARSLGAARVPLDWTHSAGWHAILGVRGEVVLGRGAGGGAAAAAGRNRQLPVELDGDGDEDGGGDEDRRNPITATDPLATNDTYYDEEDSEGDDDGEDHSDDDDEEEDEEFRRLRAREEGAAAAGAAARAALRAPPPDEDVVMVMEFTGMGRAAALDLLERHGGSPQAAVQSLFS